MSLSCKNTGGFGTEVEPGVFIDQAVILDVADLTDTQPKNFKKPIGLGVNIILQKDGLSFNPEVKIFGDPKMGDDGSLEGWGSAFPVKDLLCKVGGFTGNIGEGGNPKKIPTSVLLGLVGKTVMYLRYCYTKDTDGKVKYSTWRQVAATAEDLTKQWRQSRSKGYPRDYDANLVRPQMADVPVIGDAF